MWTKKKTKKAYDKCLNNFIFTYAENYNGEVYAYDDRVGTMKINPIPIIITLKKDEGSVKNKQKIRELQRNINKDLKVAQFKFRNGTMYDVASLMSPIATLLGIKYTLRILYNKEVVRGK